MSFSICKERVEKGDTIILFVGFNQIYALEVKSKIINKKKVEVENVFQTNYGSLRVIDLVGLTYGSRVSLSKGYAHLLYPTPELWTVTLPHRTQILYTPDISMVIAQLDIGPGSIVYEAGTGSGSLSHAFLRTIGPQGHLNTFDFHKERVEIALEEFVRHGFGDRVTVTHRDVCVDGFAKNDVKAVDVADAVFLDLPKPWEALPYGVEAIKEIGGRVCSFSPCIEQVSQTCQMMQSLNLIEITTLECLAREFCVRKIGLPVLNFNQPAIGGNLINESEGSNCVEISKKRKLDADSLNNVDDKSGVLSEQLHQETSESDKSENKLEMIEQVNINQSHGKLENTLSSKQKNKQTRKSSHLNKNCKDPDKWKNDVNYNIALPNLKTPGHTGFLTFATVPPGLKKNYNK